MYTWAFNLKSDTYMGKCAYIYDAHIGEIMGLFFSPAAAVAGTFPRPTSVSKAFYFYAFANG